MLTTVRAMIACVSYLSLKLSNHVPRCIHRQTLLMELVCALESQFCLRCSPEYCGSTFCSIRKMSVGLLSCGGRFSYTSHPLLRVSILAPELFSTSSANLLGSYGLTLLVHTEPVMTSIQRRLALSQRVSGQGSMCESDCSWPQHQ